MAAKLLIVSPVRDEAPHIEAVGRAVAAQTRRPDRWVVVDDGSTDGTVELLERLAAELEFMRLVRVREPPEPRPRDGLAVASEARAFNVGLESVRGEDFTHIGKLDGAVELPTDYFEQILTRFEADPGLGLACGQLVEDHGGALQRIRIPEHHVHGALKLYARECFDAIGGIQERLGWDTIDETYARMHGYTTRSFDDVFALHHRPWASSGGTLHGRSRHGHCAYVTGFPVYWVALRSLKLATMRPRGLSGLAFGYGYARAWASRASRVEDPTFRRHLRRELVRRVRAPLMGSRA